MLATSTVHRSPPKPGWQTQDLEEEWIEPDEGDENHDDANADNQNDDMPPLHSLSIVSNGRFDDPAALDVQLSPPSPTPVGTFLIREDQLPAPIMAKPFLKGGKSKNLLKDFFSPLALETMFEPPSPQVAQDESPSVPPGLSSSEDVAKNSDRRYGDQSHLGDGDNNDDSLGEADMEEDTSRILDGGLQDDRGHDESVGGREDVIVASDIPNLVSFDGRKPSSSYQFTFSAARPTIGSSTVAETPHTSSSIQTKQSRKQLPRAPATDPRLRLFQFQYDTYTRDHLSAMVDSIAVHTPSSDSSKSTSPANVLSNVRSHNQSLSTPQPDACLRATKRLKLTPPEEVSHEVTRRPRKDYVGESKHLMTKIKQARSPSMMTTIPVNENIHPFDSVEDRSTMEDRPRRTPVNDVRSMWFDTKTESSRPAEDLRHSPTPSSCLQPSTANNSTSLHPVYPTSTLTPSIPSSLFSSTSNSNSGPSSIASALGYRRQAADLMAQIRKDMTTGKRLVSLETVKDKTMEEEGDANHPIQVSFTPASPERTKREQPRNSMIVKTPPSSKSIADAKGDKHLIPRKITKPSPRKLLRRLSAADEVDRELAMNKSASDASFTVSATDGKPHIQSADHSLDPSYFPKASPSPEKLSPSVPQLTQHNQPIRVFHVSAPTTQVADPKLLLQVPGTNSAIARMVSGGTTSSVETADSALTRGTTATSATSVITGRTASSSSTASAASFVKHAGPVQITRIGPEDVPSLSDIVGGMRFDRELMRWVKVGPTKDRGAIKDEGGLTALSEESDDPFRSFESLESGRVGDADVGDAQEHVEKYSPANNTGNEIHNDRSMAAARTVLIAGDDDDTDDSFDFDYDSGAAIVDVMTGVNSDSETETTDSEHDELPPELLGDIEEDVSDEDVTATISRQDAGLTTGPSPSPAPESISTPLPPHRTSLVPPRSVLKNGGGATHPKTPASVIRTPNNIFGSAHRRSVSFSDGRKDGKIKGVGRSATQDTSAEQSNSLLPASIDTTAFTLSARGKRITAVLEELADPSFNETPSKASNSNSSRPHTGTLQTLSSRNEPQPLSYSSRRPFSRSTKEKDLSLAQNNQTFLTECSFGVAHDKLVHIVTDVHPYVPYWETLEHIDLRKRGIESVARLKEYLPQLDSLDVQENQLSWLTGVPKTVRTLSASYNLLTAMTSFNHLLNLESLDISNNEIDSLQQLSCLRHLRELKADGNAITSLDGLGGLDGLVRLSLKGNHISHVDFGEVRWPRMEMLNLSRNDLGTVAGLSTLSSLSALNMDHNNIVSLEADGSMPRLRTLRISNNSLIRLDASRFINLRTLYADNNKLCEVQGAARMRKLENLSLRNQNGSGLALATDDIRDIKRLYLSGNPLSSWFLNEPCYNLIYLELAACRLTELPQDLLRLIPNVRVLNLNYNFLLDARPLDGLTRLRKLTLIGSRLRGTKSLVRMLRRMKEIEMLDFRMNPCTLGWYLPILVQDVPGALQPSEDIRGAEDRAEGARGGGGTAHSHAHSWQELDSKFRRDLPDEAYVGRLAYRGLVMRACPKVQMLDGVVVEAREREKAERLLQGVLGAKERV